jgi:hypothetical protein
MPVLTRSLGATAASLVGAAVLSLGQANGGTAAKPQLTLVSATPLTIVGTGFRAGEMVRVSVRGDIGSGSARDDAGRNGRIVVRFRRVKLGRCPEYVIVARGDEGSRAVLRSLPRPCGIDPGPTR